MSTGDLGGVGFLKHQYRLPFDLPGVTKSLTTTTMGPAMEGRWKGEEAQKEEQHRRLRQVYTVTLLD